MQAQLEEADKQASRMGAVKDRVRLLHVFPSFEIGGSQIRFAQLVEGLGDDFQHLVLSLSDTWQAMELVERHGNCERVPPCFNKPFGFADYRKARQMMRDHSVDLLVTYNWGAVDFALANRFMPVCAHVDIQDGFGPEEVSRRLFRRNVLRFIGYTGARVQIEPSRVLERIALEEWKLPRSKVLYLPNGIESSRFDVPPREALLERLGLADRAVPVIGTVATLRREKNLGRLIEAFTKVRSERACKLVIVGAGPEGEALQRAAVDCGYGEDIAFAGRMNDPESILGRFDIYALSSDTEQMPFSLLEGMAAGCAVASVDVGDIRNMVSPENRDYICEKSADSLAAQFRRLLQDAEKRMELGRLNKAFVRASFDRSVMVERYREVFLKHAGRRG